MRITKLVVTALFGLYGLVLFGSGVLNFGDMMGAGAYGKSQLVGVAIGGLVVFAAVRSLRRQLAD